MLIEQRPDMTYYWNALNGRYGMAIKHYMEHCKVDPLVKYIITLESELDERDANWRNK